MVEMLKTATITVTVSNSVAYESNLALGSIAANVLVLGEEEVM